MYNFSLTGGKVKSRGRPSLNARIADVLRERVAAMKPGEPFGTEVAIADECGVSRMTARKAVNALVEEGLLERRAGVGVFVRSEERVTRRWRFIAGNLMWDTAIKVASGARREAQKIGAELELKDAGGDMRALLAEIAALPDSSATGAIVFSVHAKAFDAAVHAVAEKGFPIVVVDEDLGKKVNVSCVVADNAIGGRLVAERMASAGHRRLAFIGDLVADTVRERWSGFSKLAANLTGEVPLKYDVKGEDRLGDWGTEVRAAVVEAQGASDRRLLLVRRDCSSCDEGVCGSRHTGPGRHFARRLRRRSHRRVDDSRAHDRPPGFLGDGPRGGEGACRADREAVCAGRNGSGAGGICREGISCEKKKLI